MNVLITGAGGQLGVALQSSAPAGVAVIAPGHGQLDITDPGAVARLLERHHPDLIVNAAAYTAVDRAEQDEAAARRVNADGAEIIAAAAQRAGARLIHVSTDFVFDGTSSTPYAPEAQTNPVNVYGRTKRAGEERVLASLPERALVLRTAWVYAARGRNFLTTMLRLMTEKKAVDVVADQVGTPTSSRSLAEVIWRIAERPDVRGIQHWTDAGVASWYDFAMAIAEDAGQIGLIPTSVTVRPIRTCDYPSRTSRPSYSVLDKTALYAALGIAPVHWRVRLRAVLRELANA